MQNDQWTTDWPTEPGWYWFYGWESKVSKGHKTLYPVRVFKNATGDLFLVGRDIIRKSGGAEGVWMRLEVPVLPQESKNA